MCLLSLVRSGYCQACAAIVGTVVSAPIFGEGVWVWVAKLSSLRVLWAPLRVHWFEVLQLKASWLLGGSVEDNRAFVVYMF